MDYRLLFLNALKNIDRLHSSGEGLELDVSIEDLSTLIDKGDDEMANRIARGIAFIQSGNYQEAIDDLNVGIDSEPRLNWENYITLIVSDAQNAKASLRVGQVNEVAEYIREAQTTTSLYATAYSYRGFALFKSGQYEEAAEDLEVAMLFNPDNAGIHGIIASSYFELGAFQEGENHVSQQKSIRQYPEGTFRRLTQEYAESAAEGISGLETTILDSELLMLRGLPRIGNIDFSEGIDPDSAIKSSSGLIELGTFDTAPLVIRAIAYIQSGMYAEAIKDLTEAIKIDPVSEMEELSDLAVDCINNAYECMMHPKGGDKAIEYLTMLVTTASISSIVHRAKGFALFKSGQYEEAVEDFRRSLIFEPNNSDAYFYRGIAQDKSGRYEEAIVDLGRARDLVPSNPRAYAHLGDAMRHHDEQGAISNYRLALEKMEAIHYNERTRANYFYASLAERRLVELRVDIKPKYANEALDRKLLIPFVS
jgi:tetratricopeptide (TPR) repeat protein